MLNKSLSKDKVDVMIKELWSRDRLDFVLGIADYDKVDDDIFERLVKSISSIFFSQTKSKIKEVQELLSKFVRLAGRMSKQEIEGYVVNIEKVLRGY